MDQKLIELAAAALKVSPEEARSHCKELPEDKAWYFWNPTRGGGAVIIGEDGQKLGATSAVTFERHLSVYRSGRRT